MWGSGALSSCRGWQGQQCCLLPWTQFAHLVVLCVQEEYLSAEEFATVFKMERAAFEKLPQWKRLQLKKDKQLF